MKMNYMDLDKNNFNFYDYHEVYMKNWDSLSAYFSLTGFYDNFSFNILSTTQHEALDLSLKSNNRQPDTHQKPKQIKPKTLRDCRKENFNLIACASCKSTFFSMDHLNDHFELQHAQCIKSSSYNIQHNQSKLTFQAHLADLRSNYKGVCLTDKLKCPSCDYRAKWPTELEKHVMVHSYGRPFSCYICSKSYKWIWDLGRHFHKNHSQFDNPYRKSSRIKTKKSDPK